MSKNTLGSATFCRRLKEINQAFCAQIAEDKHVETFEHLCQSALHKAQHLNHGDLDKWQKALDYLCHGKALDQRTRTEHLMQLHPWRKGPLNFSGCSIDTEWRSDWKWQRLMKALETDESAHLDLQDKCVLDVGCGNGYYMELMRQAGARFVMGLDPTILFANQFMALYAERPDPSLAFLPLSLEDCPISPETFDVIFSMGVLYHRREPVRHLRDLWQRLKPSGTCLIETLIVDRPDEQDLRPAQTNSDGSLRSKPDGRYAQMRNVWSVPSPSHLEGQLKSAGFTAARFIDQTYTRVDEQRSTPWMRFQSLKDFLDPNDQSRTIEGHPAPLRAMILARKP